MDSLHYLGYFVVIGPPVLFELFWPVLLSCMFVCTIQIFRLLHHLGYFVLFYNTLFMLYDVGHMIDCSMLLKLASTGASTDRCHILLLDTQYFMLLIGAVKNCCCELWFYEVSCSQSSTEALIVGTA